MPGNKSTVSCGERSCSEVEDLPLTPMLATVETQLYKIGRRRAISGQQARSLSESKGMWYGRGLCKQGLVSKHIHARK
jgi:hypothetical protein